MTPEAKRKMNFEGKAFSTGPSVLSPEMDVAGECFECRENITSVSTQRISSVNNDRSA